MGRGTSLLFDFRVQFLVVDEKKKTTNPKQNKKTPYSNCVIIISRMKSNCGATALKCNIFVQSIAKKTPNPNPTTTSAES